MVEKIEFNKRGRDKKGPAPVDETKKAEPEERFDLNKFNNQSKERKTKPVSKRGKGRPKKNKTTRTIRISDDAVDIINAYKQIANKETQDDAIIDAFRKAINDNAITKDQKNVFDLLLDVKGVKAFFYKNDEDDDQNNIVMIIKIHLDQDAMNFLKQVFVATVIIAWYLNKYHK